MITVLYLVLIGGEMGKVKPGTPSDCTIQMSCVALASVPVPTPQPPRLPPPPVPRFYVHHGDGPTPPGKDIMATTGLIGHRSIWHLQQVGFLGDTAILSSQRVRDVDLDD